MFLAPRTPLLTLCPDLSVLSPFRLRQFHLRQPFTLLTSRSPPPVLIFPPFLLSSPPAPQCKPCYQTLPSQSSPFRFFKPPSSVTCPLDHLVLWFRRFSGRTCSSLYMGFLTQVYVPRGDCCLQDLCGLVCPETWASGLEPASGVSRAKFRRT